MTASGSDNRVPGGQMLYTYSSSRCNLLRPTAGSGVVVAFPRNSRKTERGAGQFLVRLAVRAAPFAFPRNSRKTERGAGQFLVRLAVRAAPFCASFRSRFGLCR